MRRTTQEDSGTDLSRFKIEQKRDFETALAEIRGGRKRTHWMWYIFPQLKGLGRSEMSEYYGIAGMEEARAYLADETLRKNLIEITEALLALAENDPAAIMGKPDDIKLKSCMTLFYLASDGEEKHLFKSALEKFYGGSLCAHTEAMFARGRN